MQRIFLTFPLLLLGLLAHAQALFPELQGEALATALRQAYTPGHVLSYRDARDTMYALIDRQGDSVYCVYTHYARYLAPGEDPSQYLYQDGSPDGINCEHAWPRSRGGDGGHAFSDMHHLFPTRVDINQARGNAPFGEVHDHRTRRWFWLGQERSDLPPEATIDEYSELGDGRFEPREASKGDIARAIFYIRTIYPESAESPFFAAQFSTLRYWHEHDLPDEKEIRRTWAIAHYQDGKPNPFVLDPTLVARLWGED
ncbi:MAG: endonuclease [Lewinella sp.]|nr:endonuclease [Lewinella sp.]